MAFVYPLTSSWRRNDQVCHSINPQNLYSALNVRALTRSTKSVHVPAVMLANKKNQKKSWSPRTENRIARMRYHFLETYECGIELVGTEIKSVRAGKMQLREGYARVKDGELFLLNVHISPWETSGAYFNHDPVRPKKLLLHKKYIRKLEGRQKESGLTIVPSCAYFNSAGYLKVEVVLARGKLLYDKREDIKRRDDAREAHRVIKSSLANL